MLVHVANHRCIPFFIPDFHIGIEQQVVFVVGQLRQGSIVALRKAEILLKHHHRHLRKFLLEHLHATICRSIVRDDDITRAAPQHRWQVLAHHFSTIPVQYDDCEFLHLTSYISHSTLTISPHSASPSLLKSPSFTCMIWLSLSGILGNSTRM